MHRGDQAAIVFIGMRDRQIRKVEFAMRFMAPRLRDCVFISFVKITILEIKLFRVILKMEGYLKFTLFYFRKKVIRCKYLAIIVTRNKKIDQKGNSMLKICKRNKKISKLKFKKKISIYIKSNIQIEN